MEEADAVGFVEGEGGEVSFEGGGVGGRFGAVFWDGFFSRFLHFQNVSFSGAVYGLVGSF